MFTTRLMLLCLSSLLSLSVTFANINYQTCQAAWDSKGCVVSFHKDLVIIFDDRRTNRIDWHREKEYLQDLMCRCRSRAGRDLRNFFAIDREGICLGNRNTREDYVTFIKRANFSFIETNPAKCVGALQITSQLSDGKSCRTGMFRADFYTVKTVAQSSPQASPQEEGEEEEGPVQSSPQASPTKPEGEEEESVQSNPQASPSQEGEEEEQEVNVQKAPSKAVGEEEKSCRTASDVFVVIDGSGSITPGHYNLSKAFIVDYLKRFDLKTSRFAFLAFSSAIDKTLKWSESSSKTRQELIQSVQNIAQEKGGTNTGLALRTVLNNILPEKRSNVRVSGIVMTDGNAFNETEMAIEAGKLRAQNVKMIAIGIGNVDTEQLQEMVGRNNTGNIHKFENFKTFDSSKRATLNDLVVKTCI